jgi:hypothetical protein
MLTEGSPGIREDAAQPIEEPAYFVAPAQKHTAQNAA